MNNQEMEDNILANIFGKINNSKANAAQKMKQEREQERLEKDKSASSSPNPLSDAQPVLNALPHPVQPPQYAQQPAQPPQYAQQPAQQPQYAQQPAQQPQYAQQPAQQPQYAQQPVQQDTRTADMQYVGYNTSLLEKQPSQQFPDSVSPVDKQNTQTQTVSENDCLDKTYGTQDLFQYREQSAPVFQSQKNTVSESQSAQTPPPACVISMRENSQKPVFFHTQAPIPTINSVAEMPRNAETVFGYAPTSDFSRTQVPMPASIPELEHNVQQPAQNLAPNAMPKSVFTSVPVQNRVKENVQDATKDVPLTQESDDFTKKVLELLNHSPKPNQGKDASAPAEEPTLTEAEESPEISAFVKEPMSTETAKVPVEVTAPAKEPTPMESTSEAKNAESTSMEKSGDKPSAPHKNELTTLNVTGIIPLKSERNSKFESAVAPTNAYSANVYMAFAYNEKTSRGAYSVVIDMGNKVILDSLSGHTDDEYEYAFAGAIKAFEETTKNHVKEVTVYVVDPINSILQQNSFGLQFGFSSTRKQYIAAARKALDESYVTFNDSKIQSEYQSLAQLVVDGLVKDR
ncbi:MAG: hypothetical protein RR415_00295 [Ruthenibacterium sp.]